MATPRLRRPLAVPNLSANPQQVSRRTLFTRKKPRSRIAYALKTTAGVLFTGGFLFYAHDTRAGIHHWLAIPVLHAVTADDPEKSHKIAIKVLETGLAPVDKGTDDPVLSFDLWGRHFSNPIGMAAGFDKHGEAIDGIFDLGFGYLEIGSITPVPQDGNPKPRFFRIPSSESVVNRYGFNSEGHNAVLGRLRTRIRRFVHKNSYLLPSTLFPILPPGSDPDPYPIARLLASDAGADANLPDILSSPRSLHEGKILGINLGKNKVSAPESISDFVNGVHTLGPYADILVINVSSPNTPGLRSLQKRGMLEELLSAVVHARNTLPASPTSFKPAVLVKIAPDLTEDELDDIASAAQGTGIDGIIVSNTTISRPASAGADLQLAEQGGLSGPPLKPLSLSTLAKLYRITEGKIPLIGCGGISSGQDALDYAKAGASFVQLYTALGYQGVGLPRRMKDEITDQLLQEGTTWKKVVGSGVTMPTREELEQEAMRKKERVEEHERSLFNATIAELKGELDSVMKQLADEEEKLTRAATAEVIVQEAGQPSPSANPAGSGIVAQPEEVEKAIPKEVASTPSTIPSQTESVPAPSSVLDEVKKSAKQPFVFSVPLSKLGSSIGQRPKAGETPGKRLV